MTPRTITAILIYVFIALVTYVVIRVIQDLDDDEIITAWLAAVLWPALLALAAVLLPLWLLGIGIDKIICNVQTRILEKKIKAKEQK